MATWDAFATALTPDAAHDAPHGAAHVATVGNDEQDGWEGREGWPAAELGCLGGRCWAEAAPRTHLSTHRGPLPPFSRAGKLVAIRLICAEQASDAAPQPYVD